MREENERLIREALEKKHITIKKGKTRIDAKCGKCGAPNRLSVNSGQERARYKCNECGREQRTL
jgi:transposase-like protein